jgi:hypothetical protein
MALDSIMADEPQPTTEEGAPWPKDLPDPELVKLKRPRLKVSVFSSAGLVFLAILFLIRINPDRKFSGEPDQPDRVDLADVINGHVDADRFVTIDAEPLVARAVRATASKGSLGLRVVPARGTDDRLWLVVSGDGWDQPRLQGYSGRLRKLADLPFDAAVRELARDAPPPVFASPAAVRAGFATGKITTVSGDTITLADGDRVAFDIVDPDAAIIVATLSGRFTTVEAWTKMLSDLGLAVTPTSAPIPSEVWFKVAGPGALADAKAKLDRAERAAEEELRREQVAPGERGKHGEPHIYARIEPIERHYETTWRTLRGSSTAGLTVDRTAPPFGGAASGAQVPAGDRTAPPFGGAASGAQVPAGDKATVPDAQIDLVGLYVPREIPSEAYALLAGEKPQDYWYVTWIAVALAAIGLVFAWALVRAARRDLFPART